MMRATSGAAGRDLTFRTGRGVKVRMLVRPGCWMGEGERARVLADMRALAARGTDGRSLEYGVLSSDPTVWRSAVLTLLIDASTGCLVGFAAMVLLPVRLAGRSQDVLHLGLTMVDPAWRGRGLTLLLYALSVVVMLVRRGLRPFWVSNVSQVPAALGMVGSTLADVFPSPGSCAGPSAAHAALAEQIMASHRGAFGVGEEAGFDARRFVITNAYTGGSDNLKKRFADAPKHRDPAYDDWCERELDYDRGDDFLQLARFTPRVAAGCLASWITRSRRRTPFTRSVAVRMRLFARGLAAAMRPLQPLHPEILP
jgi:GNAT superfamily N-acetyltransferase